MTRILMLALLIVGPAIGGCWIANLSAQASPEKQQDQDWRSHFEAGKAAFDQLKTAEAIKAFSEALKLAPQTPETLPQRIESLHWRSLAYEFQQNVPEAVKDQRSLIALEETSLGKESYLLCERLKRLSRLLAGQKKFSEAIEIQKQAIILHAKDPKPNAAREMALLHGMSQLYLKTGDMANAALALSKQAAAISKLKGADNEDLSQPLRDLAKCHLRLGQAEAALKVLERRVAIYEKLKGKNSPTIVQDLDAIAQALSMCKRFDEARAVCVRWEQILLKVSKRHPHMISVRARQAAVERAAAEPAKEAEFLRMGLDTAFKQWGKTNLRTGSLYYRLSQCLRAQNKPAEALEAIEKAILIFEKRKAKNSIESLGAYLERAHVHAAQGENKKASQGYSRVLRHWEKVAGPEHQILLEPLKGLRALKRKEKDEAAVKELDRRISKINETQKKS